MPKMIVDTDEVYDVLEASHLMGLGYATLYRKIKAGKLIAIKLSGRTFIPKSEVERLRSEIERLQKESGETQEAKS